MSGPGDGGVEGLHDPPTGEFDTAAIAAAGDERGERERLGASRLMGHDASDRFSKVGPARAALVTPMVSTSIVNGGYLRAMLGNAYFVAPAIGAVLGVWAGINTSGLAVPPVLWLTIVLIVVGAFDALSGLAALVGFAAVTLVTGNLVGSHMVTAAPGEQTLVYTLTGLFGLGVLWFAGAKVPHLLRPPRLHRQGSALVVWSQRTVDYVVSAFLGTFIIWLAAWQLPTLAGNGRQELFVTLQDHLSAVKVAAFLAILARMALQEAAAVNFEARTAVVEPDEMPPRHVVVAVLFWAIRGALAFAVLWEFLGIGWMTWACLGLFLAITPVCWLGKQIPQRTVSRFSYSLHLLRILIVVVLAELVLSQLTKHILNPTPLLGAVLITVGILLLIFAFLEPMAAFGPRQDARTFVTDAVAIVLLVLLIGGIIGFGPTPFTDPHGVYVAPTGSVIVADTANNRVVLIWKNGYRETIGDGLNQPADVTADGDPNGFVYIADAGNNRIVRLDGYYNYTVGSHTFNLALADARSAGATYLGVGLKDPQSVSVNGLGNLFVADTGNNRIVEINRTTFRQTTFYSRGLEGPLAVLCDPFYTKLVYIANTGAGTVLEILPNGKPKVLLSGLDEPAGLAEDPWGNLYVSEMGSGKVLEVPDKGLGPARVLRSGLDQPRGLSVDALGNLFISDTGAGQVKIAASLRQHQLVDPRHARPGGRGLRPVRARSTSSTASRACCSAGTTARCRRSRRGLGDPSASRRGPERQDVGRHRRRQAPARRVRRRRPDRAPRAERPPAALRDAGRRRRRARGRPGRRPDPRGQPAGGVTHLLGGLKAPVAVAQDVNDDVVVGLASGDVVEYEPFSKPVHLFNLRGIAAIAMDAAGNSYTGSWRYRTVVMHVAATGRDVVVNRDFRSITGLSSTPSGTLWIADQKSVGLWKVIPTPAFTQL